MNRLTDATSYEDVCGFIIKTGMDSTCICTKINQYKNTKITSAKEYTREKHSQVYEWLCQYKEEHHNGNNPSEYKGYVIGLFREGYTVRKVLQICAAKGIDLAMSTLYKYKREVDGE